MRDVGVEDLVAESFIDAPSTIVADNGEEGDEERPAAPERPPHLNRQESRNGWGLLTPKKRRAEGQPQKPSKRARDESDESTQNRKIPKKMPPPAQSSTPTEAPRKKKGKKNQPKVTRSSTKSTTRSGQSF